MAEETKPSEEAADQQEEAAKAPVPPEEKDSKPSVRRKKHLGPWLFLIVVFIGLPAAWLLAPPEQRQFLLDRLERIIPQVMPPESQQPVAKPTFLDDAPSPTPSPMTTPVEGHGLQPISGAAATKPVQETAIPSPSEIDDEQADSAEQVKSPASPPSDTTAEETTPTNLPAISPDQADALIAEMQRLHSELSAMQNAQTTMQHQLQTRQRLELRTRLRWLAQQETGLEQRAAFWSDIAILPAISEAERKTATDMAAMARADSVQMNNWRSALLKLAEQLPETQQTDILPRPENKSFTWLTDAFHLRPARNEADNQREALRKRILAAEHALAMEYWPAPRDWRRLLGALRDQFGDDAELGLPEDLREIEQHIGGMRKAANDWLERL